MSAATWLRFNLVGVLGFGVQAAVLWALVGPFGVPAPLAIAAAVFAAVSHNFAWHERFTWPGCPRRGRAKRWVAFNVTTGTLSVIANVLLTGLVARCAGLPIVVSTLIVVILLSLATFVISGQVIFRRRAV